MTHHSREFLEEMLAESKKYLPGWLYASLLQSARARSGGRARHRSETPSIFAKLGLPKIQPQALEDINDAELGGIWVQLNRWFAAARREKQATEDIVNAALWVKREIERRGKGVKEDLPLVREIAILEPGGEDEDAPEELVPEVSTTGPDGARVMFVGASPGKVDGIRNEPLCGQVGATFNAVYLEAIEKSRDEVLVTHAVPLVLKDKIGNVREPTIDEVLRWKPWLDAEIAKHQPLVIVALGKTAASALDGEDVMTLPHPAAVRKFGDSGEVARKLGKVKPFVEKAERETQAERIAENWGENWHEMFPVSGRGQFVYQHHWRGLTEDETRMSDRELLDTDHSLHGDLRFSGPDGLWGFSVFLGKTVANRGEKDRFLAAPTGKKIQVTPKMNQPDEWLEVGVGKPKVIPPGGPGATSEKFSKFFGVDGGSYQIGVVREHAVELFLDSENLKGRYLLTFAPIGERRRWLIYKPENQTPIAERRDLADVISELRKTEQRFLIWAKPGTKPVKYDVRTGEAVTKSEMLVPISKADSPKQIVYGVVMDPYGEAGAEPDAHADWPTPECVEETAHDFAMGERTIGVQHQKKADACLLETWVEQYPTPEDREKAFKGLPHKVGRRPFGDDVVHSGSWCVGVKLGKKEWDAYQRGELNAFSPGGFGIRREMKTSQLPEVEFIDFVPKGEA